MNNATKRCSSCKKLISPLAKLTVIENYTGKVIRKYNKRARESSWNFHSKCFEELTGVPVLPVEIKMVVKRLPKELTKNEFKNPETEIGSNGSETVAPNLP